MTAGYDAPMRKRIDFWRHEITRANGLGLVLLALLVQLALPIAHAREMAAALDGQDDAVARAAMFRCLAGNGLGDPIDTAPANAPVAGKMPAQCPLCQSLGTAAALLPPILADTPLPVAAMAQLAVVEPAAPSLGRAHTLAQSRAPPLR